MRIYHSGVHRCRGEAVDKIIFEGPPINILSAYDWFRNNCGPDRGDKGFEIICNVRKNQRKGKRHADSSQP